MAAEDVLLDALVDQHARIRDLARAAVAAPPAARADACARLARYVAVHAAAERVALNPPGHDTAGAARAEAALVATIERLDDLGAHRGSSTVQLGLLADVLVRHTRAGEDEAVPRFVAARDDFDLRWAATALDAVEDLVAETGPTAEVPDAAGVRHQLRAAREAVLRRVRHR
ncbi:hemerythrin domain-containing protein [Phycicoccus sonneratiae]|uniref:Hemerythrin HHE cation binding domain-containing protein n=1 Tax=Phycicoccus sonneratiae TaxID=2807628 RepID=A0ABS2CFY1_9MICO|nr:hemerythrin domain-containing protein [Phycicoccus sonneraticus]MBM6398791.1 hypothetical protein [Phycicoccus sonneraticus]